MKRTLNFHIKKIKDKPDTNHHYSKQEGVTIIKVVGCEPEKVATITS